MNSPLRTLCLLAFVILFAGVARAHVPAAWDRFPPDGNGPIESCNSHPLALITWAPVEVECPVCKTKNTFLQWVSYGSYVYQDPSKYQLVFFPFTSDAEWWSCKKCRYTASGGDFKTVSAEKLSALKQALAGVSLPPQKEFTPKNSHDLPYLKIPAFERLVAAEKVYSALERSDGAEEFWNFFYRLQGYYFGEANKTTEADEARRKALAITERLLKDEANKGRRKELLYISGAMRHFLRDDVGALKDFEEAKKLRYSLKELDEEKNGDYDSYLKTVIDEYIEMLKKGKGPRETIAFVGERH